MKKVLVLASASLLVMAILFACASTEANLSRETARFIGDLTPDQVAVSNVNRGMTNVDWKAATPKGNYSCSADDMVRRVNCVKK
jgi:hypothetical protein